MKQFLLFGELSEQIDTQFPGASDRVRFWEVQRQLMNFLIGGLIEGTVAAAEAAECRLCTTCATWIIACQTDR